MFPNKLFLVANADEGKQLFFFSTIVVGMRVQYIYIYIYTQGYQLHVLRAWQQLSVFNLPSAANVCHSVCSYLNRLIYKSLQQNIKDVLLSYFTGE